MSLLEYGKFKKDVDFTDADFLDKLEAANNKMKQRETSITKTGKKTDIIRKQNKVIDQFFDEVFGNGSSEKLFGTSQSALKRAEFYNAMFVLASEQSKLTNDLVRSFQIDKKRK